MGLKEAIAMRSVGGSDTDEGWVVFFTFPCSSLCVFGCVSPCGGDKNSDLTSEDVLGNHFRWSVLEVSHSLSLRVCFPGIH